ncbi:MAG TPA: hypoxanthine phosphoribosyltransferase [Vicinamibacterales bacterium]|nr:hypoxanthine phosphoribosyltransferase [Vicinamibacterales bacterium]
MTRTPDQPLVGPPEGGPHNVSGGPPQLFLMANAMPTRILIPSVDLQRRVRELAAEITRDYGRDANLHLVCVLKGAFVFMSDLVRALELPVTLDFMAVASYGARTTSSGEVRVLMDLDTALEGRDVLIVEDIVDSGLTLNYLQEIIRARGPRSVRTVCLLNKPARRTVGVRVEYIGFDIDDHFVVGYGLDFDERYRNLPDIAVLEPAPEAA